MKASTRVSKRSVKLKPSRRDKAMTAAEWLKSIAPARVPRPDRNFGEMLRLERSRE